MISFSTLQVIPSESAYDELMDAARHRLGKGLFTNNYLISGTVKPLLQNRRLLWGEDENALAFICDEETYYSLRLLCRTDKPLAFEGFPKALMAELVYQQGREKPLHLQMEETLQKSGFVKGDTLEQYIYRNTETSNAFNFDRIGKALYNNGLRLELVTPDRLDDMLTLLKQRIDAHAMIHYTREEWLHFLEQELCCCILDEKSDMVAVAVSSEIHGGYIAEREDYMGTGICFWFMQYTPVGSKGWININNKASIRFHKRFGFEKTGRAVEQWIMKGSNENA